MDTLNGRRPKTEKRALFVGQLNFIGLADVFQILGGNSSTGILHITSPYAKFPGIIYFFEGNPISAKLDTLSGIDAIYALFGWNEGHFEFCQEKISTERTIEQSRMQIVLDALRMLDDGQIEKIGAPSFLDVDDPYYPNMLFQKEGSFSIIKGPLVDYMCLVKEEKVPDGNVIVSEGAYGNWVWVILDGQVQITRQTARGPLVLAQLGKGSFIGNFTAFLFQDFVRSATAIALGNVQLGLLDTQRLSGEFATLSWDFKRLLLNASERLRHLSDKTVQLIMEGYRRKVHDGGGNFSLSRNPSYRPFVHLRKNSFKADQSRDLAFPLVPLMNEEILHLALFSRSGQGEQTRYPWGEKTNKEEEQRIASLKREYEDLSLTFRNMLDNLANCIAATANVVHELQEGKQLLTKDSHHT